MKKAILLALIFGVGALVQAETLCSDALSGTRIDLATGVRRPAPIETLTFSTEWHGGEEAVIAVDGETLADNLRGDGTVDWIAPAEGGLYTLTHTVVTGGVPVVETAYFEVPPTPILAQPTAVDNTTLAVYTNGVLSAETSSGSGLWNAWSNETAVVVYTAADGYFFVGGATVVTNAFDTSKNPATAEAPAAPTRPAAGIKYVAPVYVDGVASNGIAYWTTNKVSTYTVVASSASAVTWGEEGATNWYAVMGGDIQIDGGVISRGHVNLILCEDAKLTVTNVPDNAAGIRTDVNGSFTVYGQPDGEGTLDVTAGNAGAGIGGNNVSGTAHGKFITINGGTVTARGGNFGAGIGGGNRALGTAITINGGTVTASSGLQGAGIGGGDGGDGSDITINGGSVSVLGGIYGAGIGGGCVGAAVGITINGGFVAARGGDLGACIGGGREAAGSNIAINSGTVVLGYSYGPDLGNGYSCSGGSGNTISASAKVVFNGAYIGQPVPEGLGNIVIVTPATADERILASGFDAWTVAQTLPLTNASTGATGTIDVNGDSVIFANKKLSLTFADGKLKLLVESADSLIFMPQEVAHTTSKVYTNDVEVVFEHKIFDEFFTVVLQTTPAHVVYTAEDGYFFPGGATAVTNAYDTSKFQATVDVPDAPTRPPVEYTAPVYVDGVASNGIAYWTTNTVITYTVVTSATSAVTWGVSGATNWFVVTGGDFQIDGGVICRGHVNLILCEGAKLVVTNAAVTAGGLKTDENGSFTVYGQPDGAGELVATGKQRGAGIGGGCWGSGSNITINGGTVTATGGASGGAGIGGGCWGSGSNITINGGTVSATGGSGAGIGGGTEYAGSNIAINGGRVTAIGREGAAGIGGGQYGVGTNITIANATVYVCGATSCDSEDYYYPDVIGNGADWSEEAASGVVIDPSAKIFFNLTGVWNCENDEWLEEIAPMPDDFDGFVIMTPETPVARTLVGGCAEWTAATAFALTNAATGVTGTIAVNGDPTAFANENLNLRHSGNALVLRVGIQVGDDAFAKIYSDGWCMVSGTGDMWSYDVATNSALWAYRDSFSRVVIGDGVTGVGTNAFAYMKGVKDVEIGDSVTNIAAKAFYHCTYVTNLVVGAGVETVGSNAFDRCYSLETAFFGSKYVAEACQDAFKITARITMDGDTPIVEAVPEVQVYQWNKELQGKTNLTDSVWIPIDETKPIPYGFHFFRFEYVRPPSM